MELWWTSLLVISVKRTASQVTMCWVRDWIEGIAANWFVDWAQLRIQFNEAYNVPGHRQQCTKLSDIYIYFIFSCDIYCHICHALRPDMRLLCITLNAVSTRSPWLEVNWLVGSGKSNLHQFLRFCLWWRLLLFSVVVVDFFFKSPCSFFSPRKCSQSFDCRDN